MSSQQVRSNDATASASVASVDMTRGVVIPVSDVDRAKELYSRLGWRLDADRAAGNNFRLFQFTAPGSGSSVQFGANLTSAAPGSAQGLLLAVSDIEAAREELVAHGVDASEGFHCATVTACRFPGNGEPISGPHPERLSNGSFVSFSGPYRLARLQPLPWCQVAAHLMAPDAVRRSIRKSPRSEKENLCSCRE
jgi:catechol 2,3-dioxygenase-like lactoylglutathione lyase family enzyme